jgi:hypothetical protein
MRRRSTAIGWKRWHDDESTASMWVGATLLALGTLCRTVCMAHLPMTRSREPPEDNARQQKDTICQHMRWCEAAPSGNAFMYLMARRTRYEARSVYSLIGPSPAFVVGASTRGLPQMDNSLDRDLRKPPIVTAHGNALLGHMSLYVLKNRSAFRLRPFPDGPLEQSRARGYPSTAH